jgi:DNA-binding CsgD family transcriptional regulator
VVCGGEAVGASGLGRAGLALVRSDLAFRLTGDGSVAAATLAQAAGRMRDSTFTDRLRAQQATVLVQSGRVTDGIALLATIDPTDVQAQLRTTYATGLAAVRQGRGADAVRAAESLVSLAYQAGSQGVEGLAGAGELVATAAVVDGRYEELDSLLDVFSAAASKLHHGAGAVHVLRARTALARGRPRAALDHLHSGAGLGIAATPPQLRLMQAYEIEALALLGRVEEARAVAGDHELPPVTPVLALHAFEADRARATAWLHVATGDLDVAANRLLDAAAWARERGFADQEAFALHDLVRLDRADMAVQRLADLAGSGTSRQFTAFARHSSGVVAGDGATLDAASLELENLGADLCAAEAAAHAARAHRQVGHDAASRAAAARRDALCQRCEGALSPALRAADDVALVPLTARERAVLELAALGLGNREIATRLFISIRTVEGHLSRAYGKLGVSDRAELARTLAKGVRTP